MSLEFVCQNESASQKEDHCTEKKALLEEASQYRL